MANDSSILPTTAAPPGTAPLAGDSTGSAYDYSDHLDRVVTALEQVSLSLAFIADKIDNINDKIDVIANNSTLVADKQNIIANNQTIIANMQVLMESYQKAMKDRSEGEGIHIKGPYEWLSMAAIYRIFVEQGIDFDSIKQQVEALPKQQGFE